MVYFYRVMETRLQEDIAYFKVILLLGARQIGKSTLFKQPITQLPAICF